MRQNEAVKYALWLAGFGVAGGWILYSTLQHKVETVQVTEGSTKLRAEIYDLMKALDQESEKARASKDFTKVDALLAQVDEKSAQLAKLEGNPAPASLDRAAYHGEQAAPVDRCCPNGGSSVAYGFSGVYFDSKCKRPVAQASHEACTRVAIPTPGTDLDVYLYEPMSGVKAKDMKATVVAGERVKESVQLYKLRSGQCSPLDTSGTKRTPDVCQGGRTVCRKADALGNASDELACSGCALDRKGCPAHEGSMAYVEVAPKR